MTNSSEKKTAVAPRPTPTEAQPAPADIHTVTEGESLDDIATTHDTSTAALQRINGIKRADLIWPGMPLRTR